MLEASDITIGYGHNAVRGGINFSASPGECILLSGPNGCGKSTLLRTIAGILPVLGGNLHTEGSARMVPSRIPKVKGFTLRQFLRTGCYLQSDWGGRLGPEALKAEADALKLLSLDILSEKDISTLSDGQFQKACIASALAASPDIVLLDEPTAFLDPGNKISVMEALRSCAREKNVTVVFSSHDIHFAVKAADRVFCFGCDGGFYCSGPSEGSRDHTVRLGISIE